MNWEAAIFWAWSLQSTGPTPRPWSVLNSSVVLPRYSGRDCASSHNSRTQVLRHVSERGGGVGVAHRVGVAAGDEVHSTRTFKRYPYNGPPRPFASVRLRKYVPSDGRVTRKRESAPA